MKIRLYLFLITQLITGVVFGQEELIEKRLTVAPTGLGNTYIPYSTGDIYLTSYTGSGNGNLIFRTFDGSIYTDRFRITPLGNLGLGTINPEARLHVSLGNYGIRSQYAVALLESNDAHLDILSSANATWGSTLNLIEGNGADNTDIWSIARQTSGGSGNSSLWFNFGTNNNHINTNIMILMPNGNIGIGTTNPQFKLSVDGTIQAKEVRVETGWSDFVFEEDYQLRSLSEVEAFIQENGHLPDIPSAEEVVENGVNVGEMESKLLQKIEELTLYVIELKKENDQIKSANEELKNENNNLRTENTEFVKLIFQEIEKLKSQIK